MIQGANGPFIVPTSEGTYTVRLGAANGCNEISQPFVFLATNNVSANDEFQVYPNPSAGRWTIQTSGPAIRSTCEIYDNQGQLVYREQIHSSKYEITADLATGVYLMKIITGQNTYLRKLVKL